MSLRSLVHGLFATGFLKRCARVVRLDLRCASVLQARCAQTGMGLCLARRTVLRAFIRGFNAHLMALEDAWVRMEMREYYDEPPDDSDW